MSYEFNEQENGVFSSMSKAMKFVGIFEIIFGGLQVLSAIFALFKGQLGATITSGVQAVLFVVFGLWTLKASEHVMKIVTTQGDDISHLMSAMGQLDRLYNLQKTVLIVCLVLIAIGFVLGFMFGIAGTPTVS